MNSEARILPVPDMPASRTPLVHHGKATGVACVLALASVVSGCATPPAPTAPAIDIVGQRIDEALTKAASLPEFTRGPERAVPQAVVSGQTITASYHGDASILLRALAGARGKDFRVIGPRPHMPLMVQINARQVPIEELLRDIGSQFAQRADLVLTDTAIEIRHRGNR